MMTKRDEKAQKQEEKVRSGEELSDEILTAVSGGTQIAGRSEADKVMEWLEKRKKK